MTEKNDHFRLFLLAYPDNPVGSVFIKTFLKKQVPIAGIIVEDKKTKGNWRRLKKKVQKDGFLRAIHRTLQVFLLILSGKNIVQLAKKNKINVFRVRRFNGRACADLLDTLNIDLFGIVSAPILKDFIFEKAKLGCINAHPGWLPKYRGLGANAYALKNGDAPGITIHYIDAGIDTGRIILREKIPVLKGDTVAKINDRAVARGAELMADVIQQIRNQCLEIPEIDESQGLHYRSMPYPEVKALNRQLRRKKITMTGEVNALS